MSMFNFLFGSSKSQSNRQSRQKPSSLKRSRLSFETLENRDLLSVTNILSEAYTDTVATADGSALMYLDLKSDTTGKWLTFGINVNAANGSSLDPSKLEIKYKNTTSKEYEAIPAWTIFHQNEDAKTSTIIVTLPADVYQVFVKGDKGTTGAFNCEVFVPGGTKDKPTSIDSYVPFAIQAGMQQETPNWTHDTAALYQKLLGSNYSNTILADHPNWDVTGSGTIDILDGQILSSVSASGKPTVKITKTAPEGALKFSAASVAVDEKVTAFGPSTSAITVTGGTTTNLKDYTVSLSSNYTISGGNGADLSKVQLPTLVSGTDYKFEDGKFYFNPNGKFDFIPKGTTGTLTLTFTATDKTNTSLTGTGTITVMITGMNDTPEISKKDIDLTSTEIWTNPWSETTSGETVLHPDSISLVIDGKDIKLGSTVIATINDKDVSDTFQFATIGFPAGTSKLENGSWVLYTDSDPAKVAGIITLSSDGRTLTYKSAGNREDSLFKDLKNGEVSEKFAFSFTVKDNRGVTTAVTAGDQKSESLATTVELKVKAKTDAELAITVTPKSTDTVSIKAQDGGENKNPTVSLDTFFTVDYTDSNKIISYEYVDLKVTGSASVTVTDEIAAAIKQALVLSGSNKTDGKIEFVREYLTSAANNLLNGLGEDEYVDVSFKIRVKNEAVQTEYADSQTIHIKFEPLPALKVTNATMTVGYDYPKTGENTIIVGTSTVSGGMQPFDYSAFYDVEIDPNYVFTYNITDGVVRDKPELVYGEDYWYVWSTLDSNPPRTNEIHYYFKPNGKFDFLKDGGTATCVFTVHVYDKVNPLLFSTSTLTVTITGPEEDPGDEEDPDDDAKLEAGGGPFVVQTYDSIAQMPASIVIEPVYTVSGAALPAGYTFSGSKYEILMLNGN
ncbi:MAG: hypothetical protein ACRC2T_19700, partial [Thermoguttaceae bacterium]